MLADRGRRASVPPRAYARAERPADAAAAEQASLRSNREPYYYRCSCSASTTGASAAAASRVRIPRPIRLEIALAALEDVEARAACAPEMALPEGVADTARPPEPYPAAFGPSYRPPAHRTKRLEVLHPLPLDDAIEFFEGPHLYLLRRDARAYWTFALKCPRRACIGPLL